MDMFGREHADMTKRLWQHNTTDKMTLVKNYFKVCIKVSVSLRFGNAR